MTLIQELNLASQRACAKKEVFSGCGITADFGEASTEDGLERSGYGNKASDTEDDCEFVSKECPKCHKKDVKTIAKDGKYYGSCGCKS